MPRKYTRKAPRPTFSGAVMEEPVIGLIGYEEATRAALTAVAAGEHMLILGGPGRAKSGFTRMFFAMFEEAKTWEVQLTKSCDESRIFGIPNIQKLMQGEIDYADHIPALEADFWHIDEFFDGSDVILRSLLGCMEERQFIQGSVPRKVALKTCIATANYSRVNELTEAVIDRFAVIVITPVLTATQRQKLYTWKLPENRPAASLERLRAVGLAAESVHIPTHVIRGLVNMCERHAFSPRRERKLAKLLRTFAALQGKCEVDTQSLEPFKWALPITVAESARMEALADLVKVCRNVSGEEEQLAEIANAGARETSSEGCFGKIMSLLQAYLVEGKVHTEEVRKAVNELYERACKVYGKNKVDEGLGLVKDKENQQQ